MATFTLTLYYIIIKGLLLIISLGSPEVDLEDCLPLRQGREVDGNLSVESPWPQQCLVQNVHPIGRCQHDHTLQGIYSWSGRLEVSLYTGVGTRRQLVCTLPTIHFHQELVEGIFLFVMTFNCPVELDERCLNVKIADKMTYPDRLDRPTASISSM